MNEEVTRTRVILDKKIEERFPLNYDAIQELAEKADELNSCLFVSHCSWYKGGESKYIVYIAFHEVINKFYIGFVFDLEYEKIWEDLKAQFLAYRLLFNLISNDNTKLHVEVLNACKETTRAWELFNRIEYLINNFETEILLSDTEDTENG
nr:MAG TPA: hypothetical protein [Caudoviricetes sp.]